MIAVGKIAGQLIAPAIVVAFGWQMVPKVYAVGMLVAAIAFWMFTFSDPNHKVGGGVTIRDQLLALKDPRVWKYSQFYSIVFGGYVALSLWMTKYYVTEYGFNIETAALLAACFSLPGGLLRAMGGYLSDKFGAHTVTWWVMWVSLVALPSSSGQITNGLIDDIEQLLDILLGNAGEGNAQVGRADGDGTDPVFVKQMHAQLFGIHSHAVVGAIADVGVAFRGGLHVGADAAVPDQVHRRPQ